MALTTATGGAVKSHGRAPQKRYCPRCTTRVSRSASRCGYCGRLLRTRKLAAVALLLAVLVTAAARLAGLI